MQSGAILEVHGNDNTARNVNNWRTWVGCGLDAHNAFRIIGLCGLVGVLVDFDHIAWVILSYYLPQAYFYDNGRFLHLPMFIVTCCAICGVCAYIGGLYFKHILRKK